VFTVPLLSNGGGRVEVFYFSRIKKADYEEFDLSSISLSIIILLVSQLGSEGAKCPSFVRMTHQVN
jgi:hypothetical protein